MPYIKPEDRERIEGIGLNELADFIKTSNKDWTPGDINYAVTRLVGAYLNRAPISYERLNAMVGVLECAKQELYRRIVASYEDKKIEQNGDVYPSCS